jgi:hypothetical protein
VLESIAAQLSGPAPVEIVVITDGNAQIDQPPQLATRLRDRNTRLHLLGTADASDSAVAQLAQLSGGQVVWQPDPRQWTDASRQLTRAAASAQLMRSEVSVSYAPEIELAARKVSPWNRAWLKDGAAALGHGQVNEQAVPMLAEWRIGAGQVAAFAFSPSAEEIQTITSRIQRPPRDPRFAITWNSGPELWVTIDAIDDQRPMNGLGFRLVLDDGTERAVPQTAPGKYELGIPAPRRPALATVQRGELAVDRFVVAGRYPREFDGIGNDRQAMQRLAQQSGGAVIEPSQTTPIDIDWPRRRVSLTGVFVAVGILVMAGGLVVWRLR